MKTQQHLRLRTALSALSVRSSRSRLALAGALFAATCFAATPTLSQGTSLDSFDLDSIAPGAGQSNTTAYEAPKVDDSLLNASTGLGDCLVSGGDNCSGEAKKSSKSFSLDDLQNLGVIEEEPAPPPIAATEATPQERRDQERRQAAIAVEKAKPLPSIDIEVLFAYNDAQPLPSEYGKIYELAAALSDPRLADKRFVLLGHTDAAGSDAYNLELSQRRSEALAQALVRASGLPRHRFVTAGRGERDLKTPWAPEAAENRRVQIVLLDR